MQDLRLAFRSLLKTPGFTVTAVLTLALGLGASTAIFSVVHGMLLAPLPYRDPARIVQIRAVNPEQGASVLWPAMVGDLQRDAHAFTVIAGQRYDYVNLTKAAAPEQLTGVGASVDYFKVWDVAPFLGRTWRVDEARLGQTPVVVLGYALWQKQFAGRADIVGQPIMLDGVAHTVLGVMPASFKEPWANGQLWRPIPTDAPEPQDRSSRYWTAYARLADSTTPAQTAAELTLLSERYATAFPKNHQGWKLTAINLVETAVGDYRTGVLVVLGAVGCVLLITCANVAGLAVVRASARRKEFAIRAALGASRRQLLRQLLGESLLLAFIGGALGVLLGSWGVSGILALVGEGYLPRSEEIALNLPVLAASLALTLLTGLAFGLAPGWTASRTDAGDALKDAGTRGSAGPAARRLRSGLVVTEIALALLLLSGAGLLGRSFISILQQKSGLRSDQVLSIGMSLSSARYPGAAQRAQFYDRVLQEVTALPGVESAGFTQTVPFRWGIPVTLKPEGSSAFTAENLPQAFYDSVSAGYFATMGIPLQSGRIFADTDTSKSTGIVILSETAARRYFGPEPAVGRRLLAGVAPDTTAFEVVGVVGDVRRTGLNEPTPLQVYRPLTQRVSAFATLMVRTRLAPGTATKSLSQAVWRVDPDQPVSNVAAMSDLIATSVTQPRLYLTLFTLFAGLALALAAIGLYGLIAYSVAQRTREFGIRLALGAESRDVLRLVLREGIALVAIGLAVGLVASLVGAHFLRQLLFATSAHDPLVLGGVAALLAVVALAACLLPARRATQVDPLVALRAE